MKKCKYSIPNSFNKVCVTDEKADDNTLLQISRLCRKCKSLDKIEIADGVEKIPFRTFIDCKNLADVILSDSVTEIGYEAFCGCKNLKTIMIPASVKKIVFNGTKNQWDGIFKYGLPNTKPIIHCTDGNFDVNGKLL